MSRITEIRLDFSRTFVPPGGDRYQPMKIAAGLSVTVEDGDDPATVRQSVQTDLRALLEETYRAQHKPKPEPAQQRQPDPAPGTFKKPDPEY